MLRKIIENGEIIASNKQIKLFEEKNFGPYNASSNPRRQFLQQCSLLAIATVLIKTPRLSWAIPLPTVEQSSVRDTVDGLLAFVVPGSDTFSVHQGQSSEELGGVNAGVTDSFISALDMFAPFIQNFSASITTVLNQVAQAANPAITGPFASPFANLSFGEKAMVFALLESGQIDPLLRPLSGSLLQFAGFLAYSEAGAIDPITGTLTSSPLSWTLTGYRGPSDGYDEFKGYYRGKRKVD